MRKILIIALIACAGAALSAQTPRPGDAKLAPSTTKTSKPAAQPRSGGAVTPAKTTKLSPAKPSETAPAPSANTRSGQTRTTTGGSPTPSNATSRNAPVNAPRTAARPATGSNAATAKTAPRIGRRGRVIPSVPVKVNWMTLDEAIEKSKTEKRKIFVDVYTDWCGWCKRMDDSTFADPFVAQYLNEHYYPVKFNAEQQQDIVYKDKTYHFKRNGSRGTHELAIEWLNNRLSYPTVVFLDENLSVIQPLPGFLDPAKLEAILNYFGTNSHYTTPWDTYQKRYAEGD